jgi:Glycine cleavage system T protein (aminomethyltransferase)
MSSQSLEALLQTVGSPVELARNSQIGPYVYPKVPGEFSNWHDEQHAWRETSCLFDQSHHMTDLTIKGPDALKLLSATGINSFATFAVNKAKQFVACNYDGYVIGDAILFYLDDDVFSLVGRPSAHNWVQYHGESGDYDVTFERDERSAVNPTGRRLYRYQVQGPTALEVLEKVTGGPLPEIKFFNMGEITIAGHTVRALHHGMSGVPGLELFGPWAEGDEVKAAIVEAGKEFGLAQVGSRVYATNTLESGWIPCPLPAIFTGDDLKSYREWLPANGYEGTGSLGGSFYSNDISDYYLTPWDLGYGPFVKFDHDFTGREALEKLGDPKRKKVTLAWNGEDVNPRDGDTVPEGGPREVHRSPPLQLLDVAERQDPAGREDGRRVDVLRLQLERELDALARDRERRAERAGNRGHARVGRGGRRIVEARGRAPRADGDPRNRLAGPVRRGRARLVQAALTS